MIPILVKYSSGDYTGLYKTYCNFFVFYWIDKSLTAFNAHLELHILNLFWCATLEVGCFVNTLLALLIIETSFVTLSINYWFTLKVLYKNLIELPQGCKTNFSISTRRFTIFFGFLLFFNVNSLRIPLT